MCDRLVDELNERIKEREKKKHALYTMRPYETHRRKSLTLVVTDGC